MEEHTCTHVDILLIGCGVSGINAAYRIQESLPNASYAILEARHELGGTWSQFKYPGVRSDSDLHTLGFAFHPWTASNAIASGDSILKYLNEAAESFDIKKNIRFKHKAVAADWRTDQQRWKVNVDISGHEDQPPRQEVYWSKWIIMSSGYYCYEQPLKTNIPGIEHFQGTVVHPQFWPENLDYKGKKMVIIGSGATAITLMPAVVDAGVGSVVQLQRSPSYVVSVPSENHRWIEKYLPTWLVSKYKRFIFTLIAIIMYRVCMLFPERVANFIRGESKRLLPADFPIDPHFKPGYGPWQQRMCFCPNGDYFACFASGRADIVTDTIQSVVADGIELNSGKKLDADIIVTATGLNFKLIGGVCVSVDGNKVDISKEYLWRFAMLTSLPNFGNIIGYWNASWTLGSDVSSRLFVRLIKHQIKNNYTSVTPTISDADRKNATLASPLTSTYITKALDNMPKCGSRGPWKPRQNYFSDKWGVLRGDLQDGMKWDRVST